LHPTPTSSELSASGAELARAATAAQRPEGLRERLSRLHRLVRRRRPAGAPATPETVQAYLASLVRPRPDSLDHPPPQGRDRRDPPGRRPRATDLGRARQEDHARDLEEARDRAASRRPRQPPLSLSESSATSARHQKETCATAPFSRSGLAALSGAPSSPRSTSSTSPASVKASSSPSPGPRPTRRAEAPPSRSRRARRSDRLPRSTPI
jgi:hypothetical protein